MIHLCLIVDITSPKLGFWGKELGILITCLPTTFMDNFNVAKTLQQKYSACIFLENILEGLEYSIVHTYTYW